MQLIKRLVIYNKLFLLSYLNTRIMLEMQTFWYTTVWIYNDDWTPGSQIARNASGVDDKNLILKREIVTFNKN